MTDPDLSSQLGSSSSTPAAASELAELKGLCADLSSQTYNLRIALLVLASVMLGFFLRESMYNAYLADRTQVQATQISKFEQSLEKQGTSVEQEIDKQNQGIQSFVGGLVEYSKTHPDFIPILTKHGISSAPQSVPAAPAPAAPKK
jgi:hypothetical protein